jgi:hypothetical protein
MVRSRPALEPLPNNAACEGVTRLIAAAIQWARQFVLDWQTKGITFHGRRSPLSNTSRERISLG